MNTPAQTVGSLAMAILIILVVPAVADVELIKKQCSKSRHAALCTATLAQNSRGLACVLPTCVAEVGISNTLQNASDVRMKALDFISDEHTPALDLDPLHACVEVYFTIMTYLNKCIRSVERNDYADAESVLGRVQAMAAGCEKGLHSQPSLMTPYNDMFAQMVDVSRDLVEYLFGRMH